MDDQKPLSFSDIISSSSINLSTGSSITLSDITIALIASLICAAIILYTYKFAYQEIHWNNKSMRLKLFLIFILLAFLLFFSSGVYLFHQDTSYEKILKIK